MLTKIILSKKMHLRRRRMNLIMEGKFEKNANLNLNINYWKETNF